VAERDDRDAHGSVKSGSAPGGRVAVIINPISGLGARPETGRRRAEMAAAAAEAHGVAAEIFVTERRGHARELAQAAVARGTPVVVAWGGDGTVNEVASALVFRQAALGIVPSGSGNGLARELGVPLEPRAAFALSLAGRRRRIDAGELGGHLFFNVAGVGLDAEVAHRFAEHGTSRRGLSLYVTQSAKALLGYRPQPASLTIEGVTRDVHPLIVAFANARQYGNGALIAPRARVDDGLLDVVVIDHRSLLGVLRRVPALFRGRLADVPGVSMQTAAQARLAVSGAIQYHVDGEPCAGEGVLVAAARAGALLVCAGGDASYSA
jgi:YegS/Rv2252/BmrU family lipid kinase